MRSISILIPSYNAEKTLRSVIERIPASLWDSIAHLYLINDGSNDRTGSVITELTKENKICIPLQHPINYGYGAAVKNGLHCCRSDGCDYAVCLHADGQYPPELIERGIHKMEVDKIDLLQGSRIASGTALSGGMPFYKYLCGQMLTKIENMVFKLTLTDYHSGFLMYDRPILNALTTDRLSNSFDFDLEMIASARASGFVIGEMPIPTRYAGEKSYLHPVKYGIQVLQVLFRYTMGKYNGVLNPQQKNLRHAS
jgi:glycosyltransferase involved in cell wall biosynthesis